MKGGRKNLKIAKEELNVTIQAAQSIVLVVSLRGSNLIEVMDAEREFFLALFPAKFQKTLWIKRGSYVVVDQSGKEKALESGSKVACIVCQVLDFKQVRQLQKSPDWPEVFRTTNLDDDDNGSQQRHDIVVSHQEDKEVDSSDDDSLPPLEANTNRRRPPEWQSDSDSDSESDTDSQ